MPSPGSVRISSLVVGGKTQTWIGVRTGEALIDNLLCCFKLFSVAVYQIKQENTYDVAFTYNSYPISSEISSTFPFSYHIDLLLLFYDLVQRSANNAHGPSFFFFFFGMDCEF